MGKLTGTIHGDAARELILNAVIDEFKIEKVDEKIKRKLSVSKLLP